MKPIRTRIILVRPRNPTNIGAIARAMANFGFTDLAVVDPYEPIWKETRSAPGAEDLVRRAKRFDSIKEATRGFKIHLGTSSFHQRPAEHAIVLLPQLASYLAKQNAVSVALLFGSERSGLSNEELAHCQAIIQIPTQDKTPSMNLAQAVAVVLYEWSKPPSNVTPFEKAPLSEEVLLAMARAAEKAGYPPGYTQAARLGRLRQALAGASLPAESSRFLLSWTRWLTKKLK